MTNYTKNNIGSGYNTTTSLNAELEKVETAVNSKLDKTGGSLSGDVSLESNDLLNVNHTYTAGLTLNGLVITGVSDLGEVTFPSLSSVTYTNTATGATGRGLQSKLDDVVSVKDFGAVGDGVTDDTVALNLAIASGKDVYIPEGLACLFNSSLTITTKLSFHGKGKLKYSGTGFAISQTEAMTLVKFEGVALEGDGTNDFFEFGFNIDKITFKNCTISNFDRVISDNGTVTVLLDEIEIASNTIGDCGSGFELTSNQINSAIVTGNTFSNITRAGNVFGILLGNNNLTDEDNRGNYVVTNNTFRGVVSTVASEAHAIICYGNKATISNNTIDNVDNTSTSGAEGIYTKCRYTSITGNSLEDAGYSLDGAIAVKGKERGTSTAPKGFSATVSGNSINFTSHSGQTACGIGVRNESVAVVGNVIDGDSYSAIRIASASGTHNFNVNGNVIGNSSSAFPIAIETEVNSISITNNTITEWAGVVSTDCFGIYMSMTTGSVSNLKISNNTIHATSGIVSNYQSGITLFLGTSGTINRLSIDNNVCDTIGTGGAASRGISLSGVGTIDTMSVIGNQVESSTLQFDYGNNVTVNNRATISDNLLQDASVDATLTLTESDLNRPIIRDSATTTRHTLPSARVGLKYTAVKTNASGAAVVGFQRSGSDTFRNSATEATIASAGAITVECFENGSWDVTSASSTVTYA